MFVGSFKELVDFYKNPPQNEKDQKLALLLSAVNGDVEELQGNEARIATKLLADLKKLQEEP